MNCFAWIDLDEAARRLETRPEQVMSLVREGLLAARRRSAKHVVVRTDEVEMLAEAFDTKRT